MIDIIVDAGVGTKKEVKTDANIHFMGAYDSINYCLVYGCVLIKTIN